MDGRGSQRLSTTRRRGGLIVAAASVALAGAAPRTLCRPSPKKAEGPVAVAAMPLVVDAATCDAARLPLSFSLAGQPAKTRARIGQLARKRLLGVNYTRRGCEAKLLPVTRCPLPGAYEQRRREDKSARVIDNALTLVESLPLAAGGRAGKLEAGQSVVLTTQSSATLRLAPGDGVRRAKLKGRKCKPITHIVTSLDLGQLTFAVARRDGGRQTIVETVDQVGDATACTVKVGAPPPKRCRAPIAIELVPVDPEIPAAITDPEMVRVDGGPFWRGDDRHERDGPVQLVKLATFEIDRTEVSAAAYDACAARRACKSAGTGRFCTSSVIGKEDHPINCITWVQAQAYCAYAGKRLPTEAEWEKAARGAERRPHVWGSDWPPPEGAGNFADDAARDAFPYWTVIRGYFDGYVGTAPVDTFVDHPSPWNALQMAGNVAEWTADWYKPRYAESSDRDPRGPRRGVARVVRGASFGSAHLRHLRVTRREFYLPNVASRHFGVRCARSVEP